MSCKDGFKKTEIGIIPYEWGIYTLSELYDFKSGISKGREDFGFGYPFLSYKDVFHNYFLPEILNNYANTTEKERKSCSIERGDVFLTRTSETVDEIGMSSVALTDYPNATFNGFTKRLRPKDKNIIYPEFEAYYFRSRMFKNQVISMCTLTTRASLNNSILEILKIVLPPIKVQIEIANILKSIDDKIELNVQMNQNLETMAQAIFKSWFVDFEPVKAKIAAIEAGEDPESVNRAAMRAISGRSDGGLDKMQAEQPEEYAQLKGTAELFPAAMWDSELGEVPKGWGFKPLYETAGYVNGAAFKTKDFSENRSGLPIIKIAELKQGISSGTKYTSEDVKEKYFIDDDDVLYSWSGSPETSLEVFKWFGGKGYLNQHIFKLNFENTQQKYFTYFLLQHMKPLLIRTAQQKQTTGLGHITIADMKRMLVVYPDDQTLTRYSEVVGPIYEQNSMLQRENSKLVALRYILLPKLLSGKLSVDTIKITNEQGD
jgi:type I restriction enzyme S subunit